ncbi:hypothetical protein COCOR_02374 [Corallococcus coralloides DSM 2259]|uniref:Lipoprotein n=1 Tax=Corallococcus coralloides (strain ATCC 25202 / DSM 2259 / NBRC 100086 / M2) TaxID=1144275 RepID=H8MN75_CORCM|nr:hypothetical protein [Corallococcus coralloides]AFE04620.1 hypothetical protein COCOR_02374 [Corallococcus coralloides DSM 2259]
MWTLAAILLIGVAMVAIASYLMGRTRIVLVNETGRELRVLTARIPGEQCVFEKVPVHGRVVCQGRANGDGDLFIDLEFTDGSKVQLGTGAFVNPLFGLRGVATVNADGGVSLEWD